MTEYRNKIQGLLEKRATIVNEMRTLLDAAGDEALSGEQEASFQRANDEINAIDQLRGQLEDADKRASEQADATQRFGPTGTGTDASVIDQGEERSALETELRSFLAGERRSVTIRPDAHVRDYAQARAIATQSRDLSKGTATAGGHTVGTSFYSQLVDHLIEVSGVLQAGPTVLITEKGENLPIPRTTAHSSGALVAEGAAISESDPAFNQLVLGAYKYGEMVQASYELLEDTYVDLLGYLAMQAGRAVGNALGAHLATGTGSSQPQGVATAASTGVTGGAGVTGAFTADNLIDLMFSVIAPYRNSPACGWLMRDATVAAVRKLKDTQGQYLWQPSLQVGAPDMLLGKPLHTDPNIAAVALSAKSVLFGDMSRYFVRQVRDIRFERSDDFAFANDLITFRCLVRGDGGLADTTGAVKAFVGNAA